MARTGLAIAVCGLLLAGCTVTSRMESRQGTDGNYYNSVVSTTPGGAFELWDRETEFPPIACYPATRTCGVVTAAQFEAPSQEGGR